MRVSIGYLDVGAAKEEEERGAEEGRQLENADLISSTAIRRSSSSARLARSIARYRLSMTD
jgi:hypothetical protein